MSVESRAYQRGYQARRHKKDTRIDRVLKICARYRARAERAEAGLGYGRCDGCSFWRRNGPNYAWGYCGYTEVIEEADQPWRGDPDQRIATKENFGCIRFEAREPQK